MRPLRLKTLDFHEADQECTREGLLGHARVVSGVAHQMVGGAPRIA